MKFGKTRGTESLLKLTKFGVAMLIFGDIRPHQYLEKQPKYGNLLRRRHFAAKKSPTGDALASSECIIIMCFYTVNDKTRDILFLTITSANLNRFLYFLYHFNREEILHATIIKFITSPYLCAHFT